MNLDDLKQRLAEQDAKLDRVVRLHAEQVRDLKLSKTRASLRWLVPRLVVELVVRAVAVVWLGNFVFEHATEPRFLLPAVLVDLGAVALLGSAIRQLVTVASLDYGLPVVVLQKELGRLRVLRVRTTKWSLIAAFVLWFPVVVVLAEGLLGVDLWPILGAIRDQHAGFLPWVAANVAFGLLVALLVAWASNRFADRAHLSPAIRHIMDDFAGRSLTRAIASLDEVERFEAESGPE